MAIIALKAWYLEYYQPVADVIQRPHDLRLNRNSLLKSAMRTDFLDEAKSIESSVWFQRYLEGETVEFYIEGSGSYEIANVDLLSQEIYFAKKQTANWLQPYIFVSAQAVKEKVNQAIAIELEKAIEVLNKSSRIPIELKLSQAPTDAPWRVNNTQLRAIRQSLLHIVDVTAIAEQNGRLICDPQVALELGYSLQNKHTNQILLLSQTDSELTGTMPFDLPEHRQLGFSSQQELAKMLPTLLESSLQPYRLIS
ncbi:hypothetical protein Lepto7376_3885 [[Leptolyngbya] sp. PCC 7376]|uniref:hypothetical protein n=1 Tax=[Leptolyngbya] sp. PCC 7376 TaxID=111781 RepID=UPI00029F46B9|nr:hypothetical protein [[Leptolyngbya] sp. PCC 7376]AFY40041.1 hypothetical protein Lepto7376_3885 [[Leptolyngbya] sp. PCC 7376]